MQWAATVQLPATLPTLRLKSKGQKKVGIWVKENEIIK